MNICSECGKPENFPADSKSELRPYGPGGNAICFRCAFKDDESERRTENNFGALLDGVGSMTGVVSIGTSAGPQPVLGADF